MPEAKGALCTKCEKEIDYLDELSVCLKCGVPFGYFDSRSSPAKDPFEQEDSHLCDKCLGGAYSFNRARSIAVYSGPLREMVHSFKYEGKLKLAKTISDTMMDHLPFEMKDYDVLIPVPLYIGKLRQREYNQSAVLASDVAKRTGARANLRGLLKIRDTLPQIEIKDEAERRRNVRGAFQVRDKSVFKGCSVLLIDDVLTTGSTSNECAKTLLNSGASSVDVLTLARARGI